MNDLEKLSNMLEFDPTKENLDNDIITQAIKEVQQERSAQLKGRAKEMVVKAIDLAKSLKKTENEFKQISAKITKEFGKLMRRIESFKKGEEPQEEKEEKEE